MDVAAGATGCSRMASDSCLSGHALRALTTGPGAWQVAGRERLQAKEKKCKVDGNGNGVDQNGKGMDKQRGGNRQFKAAICFSSFDIMSLYFSCPSRFFAFDFSQFDFSQISHFGLSPLVDICVFSNFSTFRVRLR